MIRFRKASRVRDIVGVCFLAVAAILLWVEQTAEVTQTGWAEIGPAADAELFLDDVPEPDEVVPVLRASDPGVHGLTGEAHG